MPAYPSPSREPLYIAWYQMIYRCHNPNAQAYRNYGSRGVRVWWFWRHSFEVFRNWALTHGYDLGLTIERIDVNGNYTPSNCTWIPKGQQLRNTRRTKRVAAWGENKSARDWADDPRCVVSYSTLRARLTRDWAPEDAICLHTIPDGYAKNGQSAIKMRWAAHRTRAVDH